jgi:putative tryptophan/tyrosine transport system substrate-binding protein
MASIKPPLLADRRPLSGAKRTSQLDRAAAANDPSETWMAQDFRTAKSLFVPSRERDIVPFPSMGMTPLEGHMAIHIRRREFIVTLGGAAATWPLTARAQQPNKKIRYLGLLLPGPPEASMGKATRDRLRGLGYTEGRDILLEARWADGKMERLDELAVELARLQLDAIIAYTTPGALAARKATTTIPIVFLFVGDPVGAGVVPSLARPGGNATGISLLATELAAKRLEILLEIAPKTSHVAMLFNDTNTGMVLRAREAQDAAAKLGVAIKSVGVHDLISFDSAFAMIDSEPVDALLTLVDPFTIQHRKRIVDFAAQRRLPAIYEAGEFVESGGLISYGPNLLIIEQRAAEYVDKIFKGAKPADLPVEQPSKFEMLINMKTATALSLSIPQSIMLRADRLIE